MYRDVGAPWGFSAFRVAHVVSTFMYRDAGAPCFSCTAKAVFVSLRLVVGRRPKGRCGAWRRSFPRSDRGYRMKHPSDLLAKALPRPFRRRNAARQAAAFRGRAKRKHRFPTLYTLYMFYTAKITKPRGVFATGRLANNSLQQWHIAKVSI